MPQRPESLLAPAAAEAAAAPFLFSGEILEQVKFAETTRGEFTCERLFSQRRDIYEAVVQLLGQGVGIRQIARTLKVSTNTVSAVRSREGDSIETVKERTVNALTRFVGAAAERLLEEVDTIKLETLAVSLGIATEKVLLLTGQATQRVAHVDETPKVPQFTDWLKEKMADAIEIEINAPLMDYEGGARGQRAVSAAAGGSARSGTGLAGGGLIGNQLLEAISTDEERK